MSPRSRPTWSAEWRAKTSPCRCREMAATNSSPGTTAMPGSTVCGGARRSCLPGPAAPSAPLWVASRLPPSNGQRARRASFRPDGKCGTRQPRWPSWPGSSLPRTLKTPIGPSRPTGTTLIRWCWGVAQATREAIAMDHRSPRTGSPRRCSGPTWWATFLTTSSPSWTVRPWRCPSRPGSRSSTVGSSIWPGGCPSMPSYAGAKPSGCCARCS